MRAIGIMLLGVLVWGTPANADERGCVVPLSPGAVLGLAGVAPDDPICERLADYLRPGPPPYSDQTARDVEKLLLESGFFAVVQCKVPPSRARINCEDTEARAIVRDVEFAGGIPFALLESDLRRRLFLRPGVLLDDDAAIERQQARLADYLEREGYIGSTVEIAQEYVAGVEPNRGVRLVVTVHAGRTMEVGAVTRTGDTSVLDEDEASAAFRHPGAFWLYEVRFRPIAFESDLERLTGRLRERGWPAARIEGKYHVDVDRGLVDIDLHVDSGAKVVVQFTGNKRLDSDDLNDLVTFEKAGAVDGFELDRTAEAIRTAYQKEGHYLVKVTISADESVAGERRLTYAIDEGPRAAIADVRIEGQIAWSDDAVAEGAQLVTKASGLVFSEYWVQARIDRDRRAIIAWYRARGYAVTDVDVARRVLDDGRLEVVFKIDEGPRRTVSLMDIEGLPPSIDRAQLEARLHLSAGAPYVQSHLGRDRREILARLAAAGYLHPHVHRRMKIPFETDAGQAVLHYRVEPGPRAYLGGMILRGNFRTSETLIARKIELEPGDPLDLATLGAAKRRLRSLGVFSSVSLKPIGEWRDEADTWLLVAVEERDVRTLDLVLGFSSVDRFGIGADYRDRNLFGRAIDLEIETRLSNATELVDPDLRIGNRDFIRGRARIPRPLGLPVDTEYSASYEFENQALFRELKISLGAEVSKRLVRKKSCGWCPEVVGAFGYQLTSNERDDFGEVMTTGVAGSTVGRLVPGVRFNRVDSVTDPRSGVSGSLLYELAVPELAGPLAAVRFATGDIVTANEEPHSFWRFFTSTNIFVNVGTPFRREFGDVSTFGGPVVAALSTRYGVAQPFSSDVTLPQSETFKYGGARSVRGIVEGASTKIAAIPRARYQLIGNFELRWYILENFGLGHVQLAGFIDTAMVSVGPRRLLEDPTVTAGASIRYVTAIGPLSFAYGWPLRTQAGLNSTVAPARGQPHFSFGYAF